MGKIDENVIKSWKTTTYFRRVSSAGNRFNSISSMIPIGLFGRIVKGEDLGWFIKVEPDDSPVNGFYIFLWKNKEFAGGSDEAYDYWVDGQDSLAEFFNDEERVVDWETTNKE